jgi:hypothetical protein
LRFDTLDCATVFLDTDMCGLECQPPAVIDPLSVATAVTGGFLAHDGGTDGGTKTNDLASPPLFGFCLLRGRRRYGAAWVALVIEVIAAVANHEAESAWQRI